MEMEGYKNQKPRLTDSRRNASWSDGVFDCVWKAPHSSGGNWSARKSELRCFQNGLLSFQLRLHNADRLLRNHSPGEWFCRMFAQAEQIAVRLYCIVIKILFLKLEELLEVLV